MHNLQKGPSLGAKNCSAPRVWGFVDWFDSTAQAQSRWTTYSSLCSRQFHVKSQTVPRPGKPSGNPAAASLIIS